MRTSCGSPAFVSETTIVFLQDQPYNKLTEIIKEKKCRIEKPEKNFPPKKAKTAELEIHINELTAKSLDIADLSERLNLIFAGSEGNANTGAGKKQIIF